MLRVGFDEFWCEKLVREIPEGLIPIIRIGLHGLTFYGQKPARGKMKGGTEVRERSPPRTDIMGKRLP